MVLVFANTLNSQFSGSRVKGKAVGVSEKPETAEAQKWAFSTSYSFPPKELINSFAYGYRGMLTGDPEHPYWGAKAFTQSSDSVGYFVLLFGIAGLFSQFKRSRFVRFFAVCAVLALLLAFGSYMPGKPLFWLWYHLPMMDKMRVPAKFMSVVTFSVSILAAFGLENLLTVIKEQNKKAIIRWFSFCGLILAISLIFCTVNNCS